MNGESSTNKLCKETPVKVIKRDVKGLLSLQQESPSQSDVIWNCLDSPLKTNRAVGGKSKSLKSSNQLTPKNHLIRKKYYSSPILIAKIPEENKKDSSGESKDAENRRILEEFQRQFNDSNYVPRNLLDNLDTLDDSIVAPEDTVDSKLNDRSNDNIQSNNELDLTDQVDLDVLAEIEEQERKLFDEKVTQKVKETDFKSIDLSKAPTVQSINYVASTSTTSKNNYFDSDDDDIILSIPFEKIAAEISTGSLSNSKRICLRNNSVKEVNTKISTYINNKLTSVMPAKRENVIAKADINRIENQCKPKPNIDTEKGAVQEPFPKKRCTSEEIAEKRRQAIARREAFLRNLKATQKN